MPISTNQAVLPTLEAMHVGLRQIECECGCGETFWQAQVGRVRKYVNSKHKAAAYRAKRQSKADKPLMGTLVKELLLFLSQEYDFDKGLAWMTDAENTVLKALYTVGSADEVEAALNSWHEKYAAR